MVKKNGKYKVALIGTGNHGSRFARTFQLHPLCEIVAAVNPSQESLDLFCKRFNVPGYNTHTDMYKKHKIDIAAPILPVGPNPQVVIDSARAGVKGIMCEKPFSVSLAEGDAAVEECKKYNIPVGSGDMYQNSWNIAKAKEIIDSGELGEVVSINVWGAGSNQMSGQGCRTFGEMQLFASRSSVDYAVGWVDGNPGDTELGKIDEWSDNDQGPAGYIRFKNGVDGHIHSWKLSYRQGMEVMCTKGYYRVHQSNINEIWKAEKRGDLKKMDIPFLGDDEGKAGKGYDADGFLPVSRRMSESVAALVDAVDKGAPVRCSGEDMRNALEMAIGIRESHRRGGATVKFPIEDRSLKILPMKGRLLGRRLHAPYSTEQWWKTLREQTNF